LEALLCLNKEREAKNEKDNGTKGQADGGKRGCGMNSPLPADPPAYPGIEEALRSIYQGMWEIRQELQSLKASASFLTYTVEDIARALNCSEWTLRKSVWLLPNYGRADIGAHPRRWFYDTVTAWFHIPEDERRRKWEEMNSAERLKAIGKIAG
jgi:hypothetical protein